MTLRLYGRLVRNVETYYNQPINANSNIFDRDQASNGGTESRARPRFRRGRRWKPGADANDVRRL